MVNALKVLFSILFVWICYNVIKTSLSDNLFKEWDSLATPWMKATLWDFYTNALVIYLWLCYKQKGIFSKIIWLVLMFVLGSIASCGYILIQLFKLKPNEGVKELLIKQNG